MFAATGSPGRVLGVDPGLTRCGLGVVDRLAGGRLGLVHVEVVRTSPAEDLGVRLAALADAVSRCLRCHAPEVVAVERVFSQHNLRTVMGTAQAAGAALAVAGGAGVPVVLHTPTEVKAAVTGQGNAGKEQVAEMVRRLLGLARAPAPADASDALALAICHLWRQPVLARLHRTPR